MGKAQSKRSVDITTEGKKDEEVVAGKVEKIEDAEDQKPQVNGDATPQESDAKEKKENEESENDKDATTEKSSGDAAAGGGGDAAQQNGEQTAEEAAAGVTTPKDDVAKEGGAAASAGTGAEEEISPLADESSKKTKKEKVKKKWSFRSISFGKKDKQKPAKTDADAVSPTTNGEATDKPADGANADQAKKEEGAEGSAKPTTENGEASEKELLNGGGDTTTTTPTEDKSATAATNDSTNETAAAGAAAATTTNNTTASSSTTTSPSTAPVTAAADNQTENKVAIDVAAPVLSNGTTEDIKDIGEKPQQNGTNGEGHADEHEETHAADIKAASKSIESGNVIYEAEATKQGDGAGDESKCNLIDASKIVFLETKSIEDKGAGGDIGENKLAEKLVEPPPLPISPPPSQVVAFALNNENELSSTDGLEQVLKEKEQVSKVPIAEIEEFTDNLIEIPKIVCEEQIEMKRHVSQPLEDIQESVEQMEFEEDENLPLPVPVKDIELEEADINGKELEVNAAATFLVEEITSKAADIVTEMKNVLDKQHEQLVDKFITQVDDEDELPPPPPTPPYVDENKIEDVPVSVEEVLNHFETKLNEIEQKVMNFEGTVSDQDEISNKEDETSTVSNAILDEENQEIIRENENEEKSSVLAEDKSKIEENVNEKVEIQHIESNANVPLETDTENNENEIKSAENDHIYDEDDLPPPPPTPPSVDDTKTENDTVSVEEVLNNFETKLNEIHQKVIDFETIVSEQIDIISKEESNETDENQYIETVENEKNTTVNEIHDEIKSEVEIKIEQVENDTEETEAARNQLVISNESEKEKIEVEELDAAAIIVDEINKLNLNDRIEIETANNLKFDDDSNLEPVIDSKTFKEINPIELKEAAAAEIKTQDLAVSCE